MIDAKARLPTWLMAVALVCSAGQAPGEPATPDSPPSLGGAYRGRLLIGAAVEPFQLDGADGALLASQFTSLVAENKMKASRLQPREGVFEFAPADAIVEFAEQHGMAVRGHTLLWFHRTPDWFWIDGGKPASRDLVLARLRRHIEVVVGRYKSRVYAWDAVNEVIDAAQPNCLRDDAWFRVVGPDYIDWAFRYAHEVDPAARLFINDYETTVPAKRDCLERVVKGLLARGVPVTGVGHQMHVSVFEPAVSEVDRTLSLFAALGLENQITEFDMTLYQPRAHFLPASRTQLLAAQGARYGELMQLFASHPEVTAVTWWGLSDAHTHFNSRWAWWHHDQPLLFDAQRRPKPAYWAVLGAAPAH
jgi:endo-1,4-beta-xylanase